MNQQHFAYVLRMGDNALILGQRLAEWCGHSPILEEDIAMANTALDHIGRARMLLTHAGELEGKGRLEDDLAFFRGEREFGNFLLCELPIGDYAFTTVRQYFLDVFHRNLFQRLMSSSDAALAAIAAKAVKESTYHARRSGEWVVRLGDGTKESHQRTQAALDELWGYTGELFAGDAIDIAMSESGIGPSLDELETLWRAEVESLIVRATLVLPTDTWRANGGRSGMHTEHMGRLLAEMQVLQRSHPGLQW